MPEYANAEAVLARVQSTLQFEFGERAIRSIDDRGMFGDTPLIIVMTWEDVDAVRLLLEAGASVNLQGEDGETALHRAVSANNIDLVQPLLDAGAHLDIRNAFGDTPLDLARALSNMDVVRLLTGRDR
jgi:uncharacterized protein